MAIRNLRKSVAINSIWVNAYADGDCITTSKLLIMLELKIATSWTSSRSTTVQNVSAKKNVQRSCLLRNAQQYQPHTIVWVFKDFDKEVGSFQVSVECLHSRSPKLRLYFYLNRDVWNLLNLRLHQLNFGFATVWSCVRWVWWFAGVLCFRHWAKYWMCSVECRFVWWSANILLPRGTVGWLMGCR